LFAGGLVGGIYLGFKESGWKGALLGGATSFAGMFTVNLIALALAIPLTWPVMIISGIVGAVSAKFALNKIPIFKADRIERFKNTFRENFLKKLSEMKSENNFNSKVRGQIETAFEALKTKIKTETENILTDTQNQLTDFKVKKAEASIVEEKEKAELKLMLDGINEICAKAEETGKQLTAVLSK